MDLVSRFTANFNEIKTLVMNNIRKFHLPEKYQDYIDKVITYNVLGGKMTRGLTTVTTIEELSDGNLSNEAFKDACTLGWCNEWIEAFFLVDDDIMDKSSKRRGHDCWYLNKGVDLEAINDGLLLEQQIYLILKEKFGTNPNYLKFVELYHQTVLETSVGQLIDSTPKENKDYNAETYLRIVQMKTAIYTFYLPLAAGFIYMNKCSDELLSLIRQFSLKIGEYFQIQDDYLDCFGDSKIMGKVGTDIQDKKCSWVMIKALELANDEEKKEIFDHVGIDDDKDVKIMKDLYSKLNIPEKDFELEESMKKELEEMVEGSLLKENKGIFVSLINKIYKRQK